MSTSVKISEECKRILDTLQARLIIASGRKISQQQLLDTLVKLSAGREEELVKFMAGVKLPLPPEEIEKLMKLPTDWGIETKEEEIDLYLYGRKGGKRKQYSTTSPDGFNHAYGNTDTRALNPLSRLSADHRIDSVHELFSPFKCLLSSIL